MNWHCGSGVVYLSEGTGNSFTNFDIVFRVNKIGEYYLSMGNSKGIKLTPEQASIIGVYAKRDIEKDEE